MEEIGFWVNLLILILIFRLTKCWVLNRFSSLSVLRPLPAIEQLQSLAMSAANQKADQHYRYIIISTYSNICLSFSYWILHLKKTRIKLIDNHLFQNFQTSTQRIIVPQNRGSLSLQTVTPQVPREHPQHYAQRAMFYGHTQSIVNTESYNSVQNGQFKPYAVIASDRICPKNKKNTERRRKNNKSKTKETPQGFSTSPNVDKQHPPIGIATTNHVTTGDHSQNSPTNKPVSTENHDKAFLYWLFNSIFKFK